MRHLNYVLTSLASALLAIYAALWLAHPAPLEYNTVTSPPLTVQEQPHGLQLWGDWRTLFRYGAPGTNAVEIRCDRELNTCTET